MDKENAEEEEKEPAAKRVKIGQQSRPEDPMEIGGEQIGMDAPSQQRLQQPPPGGAEDMEAGDQTPAKAALDPGQPSAREMAEHELTHCPFRSWCAHCVRGRGQASPHNVRGEREDQVPLVAMDYCFPGSGDTHATVLVAKAVPSGMSLSTAVYNKGDQWWLGYA